MSSSEKKMYRVQRLETPELFHATESLDDLYEEEDLVNNVVSLDATPIKQEEELASPLFSEFEPTLGSPAYSEHSTAGSSTLYRSSSTGLSPADRELALPIPSHIHEVLTPGPYSCMGQSPLAALTPAFEDSPVAGPSIPLHAPIPVYPLPKYIASGSADPSVFDEAKYNYLASLPNPTFHPQQGDWLSLFSGEVLSSTVPAEIHESGHPTAVPATPTTGLATPGYTPAFFAQDLPAGLDNNLLSFTGMEAGVSEQPIWNVSSHLEYVNHQSLPPSAPGLLTATPAAILPAPAPALSVPVLTGQVGQNAGLLGDPYPWNDINRILESDQLLAVPPPVPQQSAPPTIQHTFHHTFSFVSSNGMGPDGKPIQVAIPGMQIWFTQPPAQ